MSFMAKTQLFVKEIAARIQGDEPQAQAAKIARKVNTLLDGQLAALQSELITAEENLENAVEAFQETVYPTDPKFDRSSYASRIAVAHEKVEKAREEQESIEETISLFTKIRDGKLEILKTVDTKSNS